MSTAAAALIGAAVCLAAAPYLARLTRTVPDRERRDWWRGERVTPRRVAVTAAVAGVLGALAGAAAGATALLAAFVVLALVGGPLVVIDFEHHRLPNRLVVPLALAGGALLALAAAIEHDWHRFVGAIEGGVAVFAVLFLLAFLAPRGFGLGDVKLGGIVGAYLGWFGWAAVYFGIFAGFVLGALVGIAVLASRRGTMKTAIPFGPTLILGPLLVLAFDLVPTFVV